MLDRARLAGLLQDHKLNMLLKRRMNEPGVMEKYRAVTLKDVVMLAGEFGYSDDAVIVAYQYIKAVATMPREQLSRLLGAGGEVLPFRKRSEG